VLHIALKAACRADPAGRHHLGLRAFARRALRTLPPELLGLATAGVAGLAFMLPDLLVGTPFPQVRTTQMLAICLALPYVAMARPRAAGRPGAATRCGHVNLVPAHAGGA
jgi:hypothetical protein